MQYLLVLFYFLSLQFDKSSAILLNNKFFRQINNKPNPNKNKYDTEKKVYMINIDGTICKNINNDYNNSEPIFENIDIFNSLYEKGNIINYCTSRGSLSGESWDELTIKQLNSWRVKYNSIYMGKPYYDVWIDFKAHNSEKFCKDI